MKKNKTRKASLLITMTTLLTATIATIIAVVIINKNSTCDNHIDKNLDMICDRCATKLPYDDYISYASTQTTTENINVEATGNMHEASTIKAEKKPITDLYTEMATESFGEDFIDLKYAFDMKLSSNDVEYNPSSYEQTVDIKLSNLELEQTKFYSVLHVKDNGILEILNAKVEGNSLTFKTESFSVFLVIEVAGKKVSFAGEHVTIYDMNYNEIQEGTVIASNSDLEFLVAADDGYGVVPPETDDKYDEVLASISSAGNANVRKYMLDTVKKDIVINIRTELMPKVVTQPKGVKVINEGTATLTVVAENASSYQWQIRRNRKVAWENASGSGATSSTFIPNVRNYGGYEYRCLVGNDAFTTDDRVISDSALVVSVCDFGIIYELPVIVSQKATNTKVQIGEGRATYEVIAKGENLSFAWEYKNRHDGVWQSIGAVGSQSVTNVTLEDGTPAKKSTMRTAVANNALLYAEFRCKVSTNHYIGDISVLSDNMIYVAVSDDNETPIVYREIDLNSHLESQKLLIGEIAEFTVETTGVDTYIWQYKTDQTEEFWNNVDSKMGTDYDIASGYNTKTLRVDTSHMQYNSETNEFENSISGYLFRCLVSSSVVPETVVQSDTALLICVEDQEYANMVYHKKFGVITLTAKIPASSSTGNSTGNSLTPAQESLIIQPSVNNIREFDMRYVGDLDAPSIKVELASNIQDNEYENVSNIANYITIANLTDSEVFENVDDMYKKDITSNDESYRLTFSSSLPKGKYKIVFTLYEKQDIEMAKEAFVIEINWYKKLRRVSWFEKVGGN